MLTGYLQCLASGMNDYISKPVDSTILGKCVVKWTSQLLKSVSSSSLISEDGFCPFPPPLLMK